MSGIDNKSTDELLTEEIEKDDETSQHTLDPSMDTLLQPLSIRRIQRRLKINDSPELLQTINTSLLQIQEELGFYRLYPFAKVPSD